MSHLTLADYNKLLREHQELQLRVTRLTYIEQQLRLAQDRLDHELGLYKRLSSFFTRLVKSRDFDLFMQLAVEAMVDVLEVETAAFLFRNHKTGELFYVTEGFTPQNDGDSELFRREIINLSQMTLRSKAAIIPSNRFGLFEVLQRFNRGLFYHATDRDVGISVYLLGLISIKKSPIYEKLTDKHETLLGIFAQGVQSALVSWFQDTVIKGQREKIDKSETELKRLTLIAKTIENGVAITASDGKVDWTNKQFIKLTGLRKKDYSGKQIGEVLDLSPDDRKKLEEALRKAKNIDFPVRYEHKKGNCKFFQLEVLPVRDEEGDLNNFILILKDITEEARFKEEIIRINKRFETIAELANVGIWEWNKPQNSIRWNEVLAKQFQFDHLGSQEMLLDVWLNAIHPDDKDYVLANRQKVINKECEKLTQMYRVILRDGSLRHMQAHLQSEFDERGEFIGLVGSTRDITDVVNANKVERDSYLLELALDRVNPILILDAFGHICYFNQPMLTLTPDIDGCKGQKVDLNRDQQCSISGVYKLIATYSNRWEDLRTVEIPFLNNYKAQFYPTISARGELLAVILISE